MSSLASSILGYLKRNLKLAVLQILKQKHDLATLVCLANLSKAFALNDTASVETTEPLFIKDSLFDYGVYGMLTICLIVIRFVGTRAKIYSQAMMLATVFLWVAMIGDTFSTESRKATLKVLVGTTFGFIAQDCADAVDTKLHVIKFLGLLVLNQVVGMALQHFSSTSLLDALPPCVTLAATINWALPQHANSGRPLDVEAGESRGIDPPLNSNEHPLESQSVLNKASIIQHP
ncbi:hypothetical protein K505DRAFT_336566 [Melanomma pulvis-pyrius CBS 109.77]|uniref:Uncharacterized protein n=1 Tax=Melanomma pulvis-pyrius CBS 109.77 TaxID=1314802 RepID=A0A6A6XEY3_9PLEO|nr:hypothetical protein K505DRAFT_336566 [Melanomma pulvis-pyrius CBS 109.77]